MEVKYIKTDGFTIPIAYGIEEMILIEDQTFKNMPLHRLFSILRMGNNAAAMELNIKPLKQNELVFEVNSNPEILETAYLYFKYCRSEFKILKPKKPKLPKGRAQQMMEEYKHKEFKPFT